MPVPIWCTSCAEPNNDVASFVACAAPLLDIRHIWQFHPEKAICPLKRKTLELIGAEIGEPVEGWHWKTSSNAKETCIGGRPFGRLIKAF